jgi:hypothetical protein
MRRSIVFAATIFIGLLLNNAAWAFGTISTLGQNLEHERITSRALSCAQAATIANCFQPNSIDDLAGRPGTFGAVGAPDNPTRGLLSSSSAHCDNGDFYPGVPGYANIPGGGQQAIAQTTLLGCRSWMDRNLTGAVTDARLLLLPGGGIDDSQIPTVFNCTFNGTKGRAKCNVLEDFGLTLHASEDFYAHTNWADLPDPTRPVSVQNPPGLGNVAPAPWLNLRVGAPPFPAGLMSGCFDSIPERFYCNEGPGGRVKHAYLNKDTGAIDPVIGMGTTDRGRVSGNFARAVRDAIADTQDKWTTLQERIMRTYPSTGALMICAITHDNPSQDCAQVSQRQGSGFRLFNLIALMLMVGGAGFMMVGGPGRGGGLRPS